MDYFELSYHKPKPKKRTNFDGFVASRIHDVKNKLIREYGYSEESATDVINYVADRFARGEGF